MKGVGGAGFALAGKGGAAQRAGPMRFLKNAAIPLAFGLIQLGCSCTPPPPAPEVWSDAKIARESDRIPAAHGDFRAQPVSVTTNGLAEHRLLRVRFKLIIKGTWDGNNCGWGPDLLGCRLRGGEQLFLTSFSTVGANSRYYTQSYPDDFPWANHYAFTGATPLSGKPFETPEPEYEAAFADAVYEYDMTVPHRGASVTLDFCPLFTDPGTDNQSWAIADYRCEAAPDPVAPDAKTLERLWADMAQPDSPKAVAAMWGFVAAGSHAEAFLLARYEELREGGRESGSFNSPEGLRLGRLQRALRMLGTPKSLAAGDGMTHLAPLNYSCGRTVAP